MINQWQMEGVFQLNFHASSHYNCNSAWSWNYTFTFKRLFHIDFPRNVCLPQLSALSLYDYMTLSENSGCNLSLFPFWKLSVPMKSQYKYSQMYLRYRYTSTDKQDAILMFITNFAWLKKYLNSWPLALQAIHIPQSHISSCSGWGWSPLKLKCYNRPVSLNHFTG